MEIGKWGHLFIDRGGWRRDEKVRKNGGSGKGQKILVRNIQRKTGKGKDWNAFVKGWQLLVCSIHQDVPEESMNSLHAVMSIKVCT